MEVLHPKLNFDIKISDENTMENLMPMYNDAFANVAPHIGNDTWPTVWKCLRSIFFKSVNAHT